MSAHSRTHRVTHLTLIDAGVVSGFIESVSESFGIVLGRILMNYLLMELINVNTYIYLIEINRAKSSPQVVLLMG
jgi:hypothetical protein